MLPTVRTILLASDLGDLSQPALYRAAAEAVAHGAALHVLHVVEAPNSSAAKLLGSFMTDAELLGLRADGFRHLRDILAERITGFCDAQLPDGIVLPSPPVPRVEEGRPPEVIVKVADAINADLIVMGTRTRTHSILGRFFVGSTAQSVLQLSDRPLMIVPIGP